MFIYIYIYSTLLYSQAVVNIYYMCRHVDMYVYIYIDDVPALLPSGGRKRTGADVASTVSMRYILNICMYVYMYLFMYVCMYICISYRRLYRQAVESERERMLLQR